MQIRSSTRLAARGTVALALLAGLPGCFIELPERYDDGGAPLYAADDALTGRLPGQEAGESGGESTPGVGDPPAGPPSRDRPQGVPSEAPPAPPTQPPTLPPTAAPTEPPVGCAAGLCEGCDEMGNLVPLASDIRCPNTDCTPFPVVVTGRDPVTGGPFCHFQETRMARTCGDAGQCVEANAQTCMQDGRIAREVHGDSSCKDIAGCEAGADPRLVNVPQGQPCVGGRGICDGVGHCRENDACSLAILGAGEQLCAGAQGLGIGVCRFHAFAGAADADPQPLDLTPQLSCRSFCAAHGWACVSVWENSGTCQFCLPDAPELCRVPYGCDEVLELRIDDLWAVVDGMLCDCQVDGRTPPDNGQGQGGDGGGDWNHEGGP